MKLQSDKKRQYIDFHMFEIPTLCEYFSEMAKQGWMLEKLRLHTATFRRCASQDITFFININERSTNLGYDYVSIEDQRFSDFCEDFGLQPVCRYAFYQVFSTDQTLDYSFYDGGVHHYLQSKKKEILRFERSYYVMFVAMYSIMAIIWMIPPYTRTNFNLYQMLILAPIIFCFAYPNCIPLIKWLIKKETYQASVQKIKARSHFSMSLYCLVIVSGIVSLISGEIIELFLFTLIATYAIIPFFLLRAIFINRNQIVCWSITVLFASASAIFGYVCLWLPYQSVEVVDVIAPYRSYRSQEPIDSDFYIEYQYRNAFLDEYDFYEIRGVDETCYQENNHRQSESFDVNAYCSMNRSYQLYVIKNKLFQESMISSVLNQRDAFFLDKRETYSLYQVKDYWTYIVKDNFILSINEINLDEARIQELLLKFHM